MTAAALSSVAAQAQPAPPTLQTKAEALATDAAGIATLLGTDPQSAARWLALQEASVPVTDALVIEFADRLAGVSIRRSSGTFSIRVLLKGDAPVPARPLTLAKMPASIEFFIGAPMTRRESIGILGRHLFELRRLFPGGTGFGYDQRSGAIVAVLRTIGALPPDIETRRQAAEQMLGLPVHLMRAGEFRETSVAGGSELIGTIDGRRYRCTAGFVVTDGTRTALSTAAHCPDTLTASDQAGLPVDMPMVSGWGGSYQDVQINATRGNDRPLFYADRRGNMQRSLDTWRNRTSTRAGDFVCRWGETTGFSCGEIVLIDFAPPADLCAGTCPATWVMMRTPRCGGGDSGGPLFIGTTAIGLTKAGSRARDGRCLFSLYMSTDYMPPPWRLLTTQKK